MDAFEQQIAQQGVTAPIAGIDAAKFFHSKQSSTFDQQDRTKKITYASGDVVKGPVARDSLSTSTSKQLTATNFDFIV
eukprot:CAMPEP_0170456652 /NCGR_PEP_ID=MMETSP0123-20130129/4214_1 /TAXON_ID=182087 /ORGANISM="Favella ehrenbergii, Strain Fehren 1" /LENGTH=77 /DNA_ID=CAMNT_0010720199 /DNA_START=264 /DNA_END=497 /DNA_ORIENTATION=+